MSPEKVGIKSMIKTGERILDEKNREKLLALNNSKVNKIVDEFITHCKPAKVTVITDAKEDIAYVRKGAVKKGEEKPLKMKGHTIHFDGYFDQARDKDRTCVLLEPGEKITKAINTVERKDGLKEILGIMDGCMKGKELLISFFCLGPKDSPFSLLALQLTDSYYVTHSEMILYRSGYEQFKKMREKDSFFYFVHSAGELDGRGNSKDIDMRRIYVDLKEERVLTVNNQYAGNSVGLKKLALRLAIHKAHKEDWLAEHMFIMGVRPEGKDRVTYFTGAFPSACGKTSTAMVPGQSIVGDDIAYIRVKEDRVPYAANVEQGIFGIIQDVNPKDDPVIYQALTTPREVIFSNVLDNGGKPFWLGMGQELPKDGENYSGEWKEGAKGPDGKEVLTAHKNARYTVRINELDNADKSADSPEGVPVKGIIYGGRDSDTSPPVVESLNWFHGVFMGATLESETTAATLGKAGVRKHNPMANLDFVVVPFSKYIKKHIEFEKKMENPPKIFSTNYFLKADGAFLNEKLDKKIWLLWMEGRVHGEYGAIETPIGSIPKYEDLKGLFRRTFGREYRKEDYEKQFALRFTNFLEKIDRVEPVFKEEADVPKLFFEEMDRQRQRLEKAIKDLGKGAISPFALKPSN
jgi:phosphoenolpyruvate carboxykinase (GTP)